ncbi:MAG: type II toxin-antitoxin system VapB family antitoxin [Candidatus Melainabacteria bacterium]|nr:type II toxin-antitoxin system VapB family antitoxin [Candidatus Melainabacteria bacterium]
MATNLNIDEYLLEEAVRLSGKRTKRECVNEALSEYIQRRKQKEILKIFGTIDFDSDYDHKSMRRRGANNS